MLYSFSASAGEKAGAATVVVIDASGLEYGPAGRGKRENLHAPDRAGNGRRPDHRPRHRVQRGMTGTVQVVLGASGAVGSALARCEPALKVSLAMHPLGRVGEPADVAAAIEWLLDPATSWVTGQVLGVDGGLGALKGRPA
jgi:hypothetical protein